MIPAFFHLPEGMPPINSASWSSPHGLSPAQLFRRWRFHHPNALRIFAHELRNGGCVEIQLVFLGREWRKIWIWHVAGSTSSRRVTVSDVR